MSRSVRDTLGLLALIATGLALTAPPAIAAPQLGVELSYEASEIQRVDVNATGGQFRLIFGSGGPGVAETGNLEIKTSGTTEVEPPSAAEVEDALNAITNISSDGGSVSVTRVLEGSGKTFYEVTFNGGPLRNTDVPEMSAVDGTAPLSGVAAEAFVTTFQAGGVRHSDERVDFTARVSNMAPRPGPAGTVLTCEVEEHSFVRESSPGFGLSFNWLVDGLPATGTETQTSPRTSTYETTAADEDRALQCVATAHNDGGAEIAASLPYGPPSAGPTLSGAVGVVVPLVTATTLSATEQEFSCSPPKAGVWTGSPTWSFQWLRNGAPIAGATNSTYVAHTGAGEEDHLVRLQCEVTGANADGAIVMASPTNGFTGTEAEFEAEYGAVPPEGPFNPSGLPQVSEPQSVTSGPVTLELELPAGQETFAYRIEASGWDCEALAEQPATVRCSRKDLLAPGQEYPPLTIVTALGADAPDLATATATVSGGGAPPASGEIEFPIQPALPFGLSRWTSMLLGTEGNEYTQAGGHPLLGKAEVVMNRKRGLGPGSELPVEQVKQVIADLPPGVLGNQLALPKLCHSVSDDCPRESQVGFARLFLGGQEGGAGVSAPISAYEPEFGLPAEFAFKDIAGNVYTFSPRLRPEDGYAVSLELGAAPKVKFLESSVTLCDFGVKIEVTECFNPGEPGANPKPLFTTPTHCGVPLTTRVRLDSWEHPSFIEGPPFTGAAMTGCDKVPFEPRADLRPTSHRADSPTGLDVELTMPTNGLEEPDGIAQSNLREARVTFPEGMAVNPSAAAGLSACSLAQVGFEERGGKLVPNDDPVTCPESSKIGSVEIKSPVLNDTLKGEVYIATQGAVEGSLVGFFMVFDSPKNGILVKLPARVTPDPRTGQLTVTVPESPQQPFSAVRMHFPGGPQATLLTPPKCGTYQIKNELVPWSGGPTVTRTSSFTVDHGPGGGACPAGGLEPGLSAGSANPLAGITSPFNVHLTRPDGSDRFTALDLHMPPGISAYLKGVPYCPDSVLASIPTAGGTGRGEIDHPACPPASQIGTVGAGAGGGPNPFFTTGRAYLAGPYKGAPLSIATVVPAVAGPLDLGSVVVRNALHVDPETAQVSVLSDPIPTILHGLLLDVRDIRVQIDRPHFTLNPTNCEPMAVGATVRGLSGASAALAKPFQVGGCGRLKFKPKLKLNLKGGTKRGDHPALKAVVTTNQGSGGNEANIAKAIVKLPHSAFLDQAHIRTICTRVQYAANQCPAGSIYGFAKAVTPLLDNPLEGPVYLRSSNHKLPDLVMKLSGQVSIEVVGRIDSAHGGIRTNLETVPDAPVSKFTLEMQGGKKGLIQNSTNLCASTNKALAQFTGQNGKFKEIRPVVKPLGCKGKQPRKGKRHSRKK
jgi:hypothetical protein